MIYFLLLENEAQCCVVLSHNILSKFIEVFDMSNVSNHHFVRHCMQATLLAHVLL